MRNFIILFFSLISISLSFAQTGPGGVGNSSNIEAWMDAAQLGLSNNSAVSSWTDFSGNNNHAEQVNSSNRPIFLTNQLNGLPVIDFDGTNDHLDFLNNISNSATSIFMVNRNTNTSTRVALSIENHSIYNDNSIARTLYVSPLSWVNISKTLNSYSVLSLSTGNNATTGNLTFVNGSNIVNTSRNAYTNRTVSSIGSRHNVSGAGNFAQGQFAEIIIFNEELNSAKRKIVSSHLAAKYNLTAEQNLYAYSSTHGNQVIGVGQEADGNHTLARGLDNLEVSNPSGFGNGEYILVGNDGAGYSTSVAVGVNAVGRWAQVWLADITGTPGTVDLTFYLGSNNFAVDPNNYVVLIENVDGDFSNGGTSIQETGRIYDGVNGTVTFTGINLSDGDYFTLAEKSGITPPSLGTIDFGPGGVGSSANIEAWMDASRLSLINNNPVSSWTDVSGNSNDAVQPAPANQPLFLTNQLNSLPVIDFDGTNDHLDFLNNISNGATSIFMVNRNTNTSTRVALSIENHSIFNSNSIARTLYVSPLSWVNISKTLNSYSVLSLSTGNNATTGNLTFVNGSNIVSTSRNAYTNRTVSSIGSRHNTSGAGNFAQGQFAEIIIFNEELNSAKRKIVSNHLAAKYNLTGEQNLYAHKSIHGHNVIGLGQESDGSHLESRDRDSILINNASALGNGDYILIGNDAADFSIISTSAAGVQERWNRTWRVDKTGTPGAIDVQFFLTDNGFASPSDYVVIIEEDDGDFTNGGVRIIELGNFDAADSSITFSAIDFVDGATFTLAEKQDAIESVADADWSLTTTWNCGCVPANSDTVTILNDVTISSNQEIFNLFISNGSITFSGTDDTLGVYGELSIGSLGSVTAGDGTIAALGASAAGQTFNNTSGSVAALNNLFVNSTNGAIIQSGAWSISNHLQVSSGGLDVTNADSITLISNSTSTAQVLESMSGAFTGEFIVQRHISGRNSNYSNMASPISDATAADLDDDLVISGIGGNDGNAKNTSGGTFFSMLFFDSSTDLHTTITSTSTALPSARGYEVFLDTVGYFSGAVVDYRGSLFSGTATVTVDQGWNLIGNPYQSFIDWSLVSKGTLPNAYWIFNSSTGNYDFFSGTIPDIAPGQGFWADEQITTGTQTVSFDENDKVDNNSSAFLRRKNNPSFSLALSSSLTEFSHKMEVKFDVNAISELDELDASYLKSPVKDAPAIYSRASNSDKELIVNSLNPFVESQLIPIEIYAGLDGTYSIDAENVTELYKAYSCVYLKDKASNEAIDLSVEQSYQFETTKGTSNRFELIVSNSFVECEKLIEDGSYEQKLDYQLSLRNAYGDWYLDYTLDDSQQQVEIRVLNMAGQEVKQAVSFGASNAGSYRLQNLQDLNGIFLIQVKTKDGFLNKTVQL